MSKTQLLVIFFCLSIGIGLYFFGKKTNETIETSEISNANAETKAGVFDEKKLIELSKSNLDSEKSKMLNLLEQAADKVSGKAKIEAYKQLANFWNQTFNWGTAGVYLLKIAELNSENAMDWAMAGTQFLEAAKRANSDSSQKDFLFQNAINSLKMAQKLDSSNLDFKSDYLYAQILGGKNMPMASIFKLRDIANENPEHLKSNYYMGELSVRSGQYDKAIPRFEIINELYPTFAEGYYALADAYQQNGEKAKALGVLEQYKALLKDESEVTAIDKWINHLKN